MIKLNLQMDSETQYPIQENKPNDDNDDDDGVLDLPSLELLNKEENNKINKENKEANKEENKEENKEKNKEENKKENKEENEQMYRTRGLCRFNNIGNTCYMSATLQQFCNMPYIVEIFLHKKSYDIMSKCLEDNMIDCISSKQRKKNKLKDNEKVVIKRSQIVKAVNNSITNQLHNIITNVWMIDKTDGVCLIKPKQFKKTISKLKTEFYGYRQNDSSELIDLMLNNLHEETKIYVSGVINQNSVLNNVEFDVNYKK